MTAVPSGLALATSANAALPLGFRRRSTPHGDERMTGAGVLYVTPQGDGLFLKRSKAGDAAGQWAFPGGKVEQDEEPVDAARRESLEEIGRLPGWQMHPLHRETSDTGVDFVTFGHQIEDRFDPVLNDEHDEYVWAPLNDPPAPLHPGVAKLLKKFFEEEAAEPEHEASGAAAELAGDDLEMENYIAGLPSDSALRLALDRESVRNVDEDGRMRVEVCNLSKEQIRPYLGKEVPGWDDETKTHALGLDPNKVYQMFCPGEELERAASTFNGVQLLRKHIQVDADDHRPNHIVGTVGTDVRYEAPYLKGCLHIWTNEAIEMIEEGTQKQLSAGYHYEPEMTAGIFGGKRFDGIMRNIRGNHVALVEEGRAGPDVVVGDSALDTEQREMTARPTRLEYTALLNIARALNPLLKLDLAEDQRPDWGAIVRGLNTSNFKARKPTIVSDIKKALKGKTIAQDASFEHVAAMLDHLEHTKQPKALDVSVSGPQHRAMEAAAHGNSSLGIPSSVGKEFSDADRGHTFNDGIPAKVLGDKEEENVSIKVGEEEAEDKIEEEEAEDNSEMEEEEAEDKRDGEIEEEEAEDESEGEKADKLEHASKDKKGGKDKKFGKDKKPAKDRKGAHDGAQMVTMDQAQKMCDAAVKKAVSQVRAETSALTTARDFARPYVGEVSMALDSAEKIYRATADALGIDHKGIPAEAIPAVVKAVGAKRTEGGESRMTFDSAPAEGGASALHDLFPDSARIGYV